MSRTTNSRPMIGTTPSDDSDGDDGPAHSLPPPPPLPVRTSRFPRPSLANRIIPRDDNTRYENELSSPPLENTATTTTTEGPPKKVKKSIFPRPTLTNRIIPRDDDDTPYENTDYRRDGNNNNNNNNSNPNVATGDGKQRSYKGSEMDQTSVASFNSGFSAADNNNNNNNNTSTNNLTQSQRTNNNKSQRNNNNNNEELQEVMKDNLDLMYDIVMRIREDEDFARNIYRNCPRLQHLLDQHPDLRPLFEDPNLVRINFEKVYRDAGGILPEDEDKQSKFARVMKRIVNHPLFKVFKILLFIKKIYSCVTGGGMNLLKHCCKSMFWTPPDPTNGPNVDGRNGPNGPNDNNMDDDDGIDGDGTYGGMDPNKAALYRAAEHMQDPQVQANMQDLLRTDPDSLDDAIENDPTLRSLRDSNPLCAELMSDPESMRMLTDPDNLRALADAPNLIEQDFADPNWDPPQLNEPPDIDDDDDDFGNTGGGTTDNLYNSADFNRDGVITTDEQSTYDQLQELAGNSTTNEATGEFAAEDSNVIEDFTLGDSQNGMGMSLQNSSANLDSTNAGYNGTSGADDIAEQQGESINVLEDFALGESSGNLNASGNAIDGAADAANDQSNPLENFELDHGAREGAVGESAAVEDTVAFEDGNALEDFSLGDSQVNNNYSVSNLNAAGAVDSTDDGNTGGGNAFEDFQLGDSQTNTTTTHHFASTNATGASPDDGNNAFEDFELGDSQNNTNYVSSSSAGAGGGGGVADGATNATDDGTSGVDNALQDFELGDSQQVNHMSYNAQSQQFNFGTDNDPNVDDTGDVGIDTGAEEDVAVQGDVVADAEADADGDNGGDNGQGGNNNAFEDFELGETPETDVSTGGNLPDAPDTDNGGLNAASSTAASRQQQQRAENEPRSSAGMISNNGLVSQIAAGLTDIMVSQMVGDGFNAVTGDLMDGGNNGALDNLVEAADYADEAADAAENRADNAGMVMARSAATDMATDGVLAAGGGTSSDQQRQQQQQRSVDGSDGATTTEPESAVPKSRFGMVSQFMGTVSNATKEAVLSQFVGDDFGEMLAEKMRRGKEEGGEGADDDNDKKDDDDEKDKKDGDDDTKKEGSLRSMRFFKKD